MDVVEISWRPQRGLKGRAQYLYVFFRIKYRDGTGLVGWETHPDGRPLSIWDIITSVCQPRFIRDMEFPDAKG